MRTKSAQQLHEAPPSRGQEVGMFRQGPRVDRALLAGLPRLPLAPARAENTILCGPREYRRHAAPRHRRVLGGIRLTPRSCGSRLAAVFAPPRNASAMASPQRPRGRPPVGCVWMDGCYVSTASGEPHCAAHSRERFAQRRRRYDRARYWDPTKNVRKQRLERSARKNGRPPRPVQMNLEELAAAEPCVHHAEEETGPNVKS